MLEHGGRLQRAAREFGIPAGDWLDLSTGISPFGWPLPPIPERAWRRLPEEDDGLIDAARAYCNAPHVLPVAGSQAAIQALPRLRSTSRVGIIAPGYAEHAHAWTSAGHAVETLAVDALITQAARFDVVVLIHPNNPTGETFTPDTLLNLHAGLAARSGALVLDEAFIDATPTQSLCRFTDRAGLVVLRSVGKFFGLAGARAGFVCAAPDLLDELNEALGPWTLAGPTRHLLCEALGDRRWQAQARGWLVAQSARLAQLLRHNGLPPAGGSAMFQWCRYERAPALHQALARCGVLVRLFNTPASLRFGLPADDHGFGRLNDALSQAMREVGL